MAQEQTNLLSLVTPAQTSQSTWREPVTDAEEVEALKFALRATRHNPWLGDEVVDPEFENFMDAIVSTPVAPVAPAAHEAKLSNPWDDFFEAAR